MIHQRKTNVDIVLTIELIIAFYKNLGVSKHIVEIYLKQGECCINYFQKAKKI